MGKPGKSEQKPMKKGEEDGDECGGKGWEGHSTQQSDMQISKTEPEFHKNTSSALTHFLCVPIHYRAKEIILRSLYWYEMKMNGDTDIHSRFMCPYLCTLNNVPLLSIRLKL